MTRHLWDWGSRAELSREEYRAYTCHIYKCKPDSGPCLILARRVVADANRCLRRRRTYFIRPSRLELKLPVTEKSGRPAVESTTEVGNDHSGSKVGVFGNRTKLGWPLKHGFPNDALRIDLKPRS